MILAAKRSLQLDTDSAECHTTMGRIKMYYEWDFAGAETEFKKALDLNLNIAETYEQYGYCLGLMGNHKEAMKHAVKAFNLDPFSLMNNNHIGIIYWMAGEYEKAIEFGRRLIELELNFYGGHYLLGLIYSDMQKYDESIEQLELAVKKNYCSHTLSLLGKVLGVMGEKEKAREALKKMEELKDTQSVVGNFDMGIVYASLEEFDMAFQFFEKAIEKHEGLMLYLKFAIPSFTGIEQDPRTKKVLDRIGVPYK